MLACSTRCEKNKQRMTQNACRILELWNAFHSANERMYETTLLSWAWSGNIKWSLNLIYNLFEIAQRILARVFRAFQRESLALSWESHYDRAIQTGMMAAYAKILLRLYLGKHRSNFLSAPPALLNLSLKKLIDMCTTVVHYTVS